MELNLQQVQEFITNNQGNEEVKSYLQGLSKPTIDGVKSFLESNEDGKKYLNSFADTRVSQGIESFKLNNLTKLIDEEIKKRNPSTDPKDIQIEELKKQFENMQKDSLRKDLELKASKLLNDKNIPIDFLSYVKGDSEEAIVSNLTNLEKILGDYSKVIRGEILKEGSYTPHKNFNSNSTINPYSKSTYSLTQQMELERNNPTLASQLRSQSIN